MKPKFVITKKELMNVAGYEEKHFPKYTASIINLINRWAGGTSANVVGQMSDLAIECPYKDYENWRKWYLEKHPKAIENGTKLIMSKLKEAKEAIAGIDEKLVRQWVEDLVIEKSFWGLKIQEAIILRLGKETQKQCRLATKLEESKGYDGFIEDKPVQIKPCSYKTASNVKTETLRARTIYYEKDKETGDYDIDASEIADLI